MYNVQTGVQYINGFTGELIDLYTLHCTVFKQKCSTLKDLQCTVQCTIRVAVHCTAQDLKINSAVQSFIYLSIFQSEQCESVPEEKCTTVQEEECEDVEEEDCSVTIYFLVFLKKF